MASTITTKRLNPGQLSAQLGGLTVQIVGDPASNAEKTVSADVAQAVLDDAIAAHAYDPDWTPPPVTPEQMAEANQRARTRVALQTAERRVAKATTLREEGEALLDLYAELLAPLSNDLSDPAGLVFRLFENTLRRLDALEAP